MKNFDELLEELLEDNDFAKEYAIQLLNDYVIGYRLLKRTCKDIHCIELTTPNELQVRGLIKLCELAKISYYREDWEEGNKCNKTNWDIVFFTYEGIKFFELVEKETDNG